MSHNSPHNSEPRKQAQIKELVDEIRAKLLAGQSFSDASYREQYGHLMPELGVELDKLQMIARSRSQAQAASHPPVFEASDDDHAAEVEEQFRQSLFADLDPQIEDYLASADNSEKDSLFARLLSAELEYRTHRGCVPISREEYIERFPAWSGMVDQIFGPKQIGRYDIIAILGSGAFGRVFLASDGELSRRVAIKVPRADLNPDTQSDVVSEAKAVGSLDHPNIVPVHDISVDNNHGVFIVSKFIDGTNLERIKREHHLNYRQIAELIHKVAGALAYAHARGLVHRDIKPANILIDSAGNPLLADFGLALHDQDVGHGSGYVGTPGYMSPEQARGEGHLVDGRTDIFGLGVVLYELVTGKRPFDGDSWSDVTKNIIAKEPKPPRQIDSHIPHELERICLKALEKRASDRYQTAEDMQTDLRSFCEDVPSQTQSKRLHVIPKGLRSFDEHDADFYLQLLPGPKDRTGLPESIRFWKHLIEEPDPNRTFRVGLLYGPSGCGKTSMVQAGLLPRLNSRVIPLYVDATRSLEQELAQILETNFPGFDNSATLGSNMSEFRRNNKLRRNRKVLLVIDQFEQWLHANRHGSDGALCEALRQCDGVSIQCLMLVRDDYFLGVARFMDELEVRLVQGENMAKVDLFDIPHARRVLTLFGQSFGRLREDDTLTKEQHVFLDEAVSILETENRVIPVQLSLFAEILKGRDWLPRTFKRLGGFEGVGVTFLEETFSSRMASPHVKRHAKAAQAVLREFVRDDDGLIRPRVLSVGDVSRLSGYSVDSSDFDELVTCLDKETRLMTPCDQPAGTDDGLRAEGGAYQLTHDYLVPSIRQWISGKQRETARGRAQHRLQELSVEWKRKPVGHNLPSLREFAQIRWHVHPSLWTKNQKEMMRTASRRVRRQGALLLLMVAAIFSTHGFIRRISEERVSALEEASAESIRPALRRVRTLRFWTEPIVAERLRMSIDNRLRLSLAAVPWNDYAFEHLQYDVQHASPTELIAVNQELMTFANRLLPGIWRAYLSGKDSSSPTEKDQWFRMACLLAQMDSKRLAADITDADAQAMAEVLLDKCKSKKSDSSSWLELLRPISTQIEPALLQSFADYSDPNSRERFWILTVLLAWSRDEPARLFRLVDSVPDDYPLRARTQYKGDVAMELFRRGDETHLWSFLRHEADSEVRSYVLHQSFKQSCDLTKAFAIDTDPSIRRAVLWAMNESAGVGGDPPADLDNSQQDRVIRAALEQDDAGIYSAVEWLLRHKLLPDGLWKEVATRKESSRSCYVTSEDHTMVYLDAGTFQIPIWPKEPGETTARTVTRRIDRKYAISTTEVTIEKFQRFRPVGYDKKLVRNRRCPYLNVTWDQAASYCNWLSEREGIPQDEWCYIVTDSEDVLPAPNFLHRNGYRLPTESEWEYACRGGVNSRRYYGDLNDYTTDYMWSGENSSGQAHTVGMKIPNDYGLFDMFGNAQEWCHAEVGPESAAADAAESAPFEMVLKGGSYRRYKHQVEMARREHLDDAKDLEHTGFRIARTIK